MDNKQKFKPVKEWKDNIFKNLQSENYEDKSII